MLLYSYLGTIMKIHYKKLADNAVIPTKAHPSDAGCDLTATSVKYDNYGNLVYGTGIALEIPEGFVGLVFPRSSNAKTDLRLTNSVGVIDSHYRGEIFFKFRASGGKVYQVGDRIGQLIIMPFPTVEFVEVDKLTETDRGEGGYGSTGR